MHATDEPPFVGESPDEENQREEPDLMAAIRRAAQRASDAGYGGETFEVVVEMDVLPHNQHIKTMRAIANPSGSR
jgi:hypothetical protein